MFRVALAPVSAGPAPIFCIEHGGREAEKVCSTASAVCFFFFRGRGGVANRSFFKNGENWHFFLFQHCVFLSWPFGLVLLAARFGGAPVPGFCFWSFGLALLAGRFGGAPVPGFCFWSFGLALLAQKRAIKEDRLAQKSMIKRRPKAPSTPSNSKYLINSLN